MIAGLIGIIGLFAKGLISMSILLIIICMTLFLETFLISLHADAAEAI